MQAITLTPAQRQRVKALFDEAYDLPTATRVQWLAAACPDDDAVCTEVAQLLQAAAADSPLEHQQAAELLALPTTQPGQTVGPYRLLRELGHGGMGTVWLAERADGLHQEPVALKLVQSTFDRETMSRFQRERELLARLNHPNIARLLDGGSTATGGLYLVMEYVAGQPITCYCRTHHLALTERLNLFRTVCAAVQFAHQNFIVHRDLKPDNLFVTASQEGKGGTPKLLDFGIAKLLEHDGQDSVPSTLTRASRQPFTPLYASPEQIRNETITTASDVYSLGVLLYELLTGVRPYGATTDSLAEQIRAVTDTEPVRPSARVAQQAADLAHFNEPALTRWQQRLRGDLDNIILKALQKEVSQRYATVEQLSDDLLRHLNGEPVTVRPATWRYRAGKYVRRNRAFVTMASLLALTLLTVAIITTWQLRASRTRERQQRYELYAADMRQAGADWGEGNLVHMDELLERHRPGTPSDEWRGFEWFALWKLLHTEKFTLRHQSSTPTVVFTPDGKTLLTGSQHGYIERWNAGDGQSLGVFAKAATGIDRLQFFRDGTKLLVKSNGNHQLSIWNYLNQTKQLEFPLHSLNGYGDLSFALAPDEATLLTNIGIEPFHLWDVLTGRRVTTYKLPSSFQIAPTGSLIFTSAIFALDGAPLCLVRRGQYFELLDLRTQRSVARLDPQSNDPRALQLFNRGSHLFSPDGTRYYLPTQDFRIRVWDAKRGGMPIQVLAGHDNQVETPVLSHDGKLLASGSNDRTLRLWDTQTGKLLVKITNESQTFSPTFSPDDRYLAAVCMRALRTKVWKVKDLLSSPQAFDGVQTFGLSPDGKMLTHTASEGLGLRDLQTGQSLQAFTDSAFSPCQHYDCARLSPDGKLIATRKDARQGSAEIRELASGKVFAELGGHTGPVSAVCFSPDGKTLATGAEGGQEIKLWDTETWQKRAKLTGHSIAVISGLDFSPDGSKLVSSSYDSTVRVWDVKSGKELFTLGDRNSWKLKARFSPDGKLLASADMNFTIKLWDAFSGRALQTLKGHANSVYIMAFSPDGKRLASGSDDHTVRLWDLQTGAELTALRGHTGEVWHLFFTPDGKTLVSSGQDGTRIWRTATEAEVRARGTPGK